MTVYKIRRISDGLFSEAGAGSHPAFSTHGKTWNHARHAVSHMGDMEKRCQWFRQVNPYTGTCEIVEFDLVERGIFTPKPKVFKKGHKIVA